MKNLKLGNNFLAGNDGPFGKEGTIGSVKKSNAPLKRIVSVSERGTSTPRYRSLVESVTLETACRVQNQL